jgi:shikimate dehydrogenase
MMVQQVPEYLSFFGFDAIARAVQADLAEVRSLFVPVPDGPDNHMR